MKHLGFEFMREIDATLDQGDELTFGFCDHPSADDKERSRRSRGPRPDALSAQRTANLTYINASLGDQRKHIRHLICRRG
jgi:hypothetical protein